MQHDLGLGDLERPREGGNRERLPLVARVDVAGAIDELDQGVGGLERKMQRRRRAVGGLEGSGGVSLCPVEVSVVDHEDAAGRVRNPALGFREQILFTDLGRGSRLVVDRDPGRRPQRGG